MNKSILDFENINNEIFNNLVLEKIAENESIEYKGYTFPNGAFREQSNDKKEILETIVAFANNNGGFIIIGIKEDKDTHIPTTLSGTKMSSTYFDAFLNTLKQLMIARIRPILYGVQFKYVEVESDNIAIVIKVSKSYNKPHCYFENNKYEFPIRYVNGNAVMDYNAIRSQFLQTNTFMQNFKQFRQDRISAIMNNDTIMNLKSGAKIALHIVPLSSFEHGNIIDLSDSRVIQFKPLSVNGYNYRYNIDGFYTSYEKIVKLYLIPMELLK